MKEKFSGVTDALLGLVGAAPTWTTAGILALLGIAGSTSTVVLTLRWLTVPLIVLSVLLLGRAFYILYVLHRGNRVSAVITWASALLVVGFWTWQWIPWQRINGKHERQSEKHDGWYHHRGRVVTVVMNPHRGRSPARVSRGCRREPRHRLARAGVVLRVGTAAGLVFLQPLRARHAHAGDHDHHVVRAGFHDCVLDMALDVGSVVHRGNGGCTMKRANPAWPLLVVTLTLTVMLAVMHVPDQPTHAQPPAAGSVLNNSIGMKLAYIPAGSFQMGSPAGEAEREEEEMQHEVTLSKPYYIGVYEVTQEQFKKVPVAPGLKVPVAIFGDKRGGGPSHPMENVQWDQAVAFCKTLSDLPDEKMAGRKYRLPTEAEWEYACRAGTTTTFHFGKSLSAKQANFNGNYPYGGADKGPYLKMTSKVGSFSPNAWGLFDMHGNVAEWCADYYDKDYYSKSPKVDPQGPDKGVVPTDYNDFYRVIRGGCWLDEARACRAAYRFRAMPHDPYRLIGFRVVCEVKTKN